MNAVLKTYLTNLNERDRWTLGFGAAFCIVYLFYLLIYSPLTSAVQNKSQQLLEKKETLAWMQQVSKLEKTKKRPKKLTSSQLLTVLADQLNTSALKQFPYQLQQTGVSDMQLIFNQVPYNLVVAWLWSLNEKYAISIKQLNVERSDTPGIVKLTATISP